MPVRTSFEGLSKPARSAFETQLCRPLEDGDISDLFDDAEPFGSVDVDDDEGMEDLFDDDPVGGDPGDGLEGLL